MTRTLTLTPVEAFFCTPVIMAPKFGAPENAIEEPALLLSFAPLFEVPPERNLGADLAPLLCTLC